MLTPQEFEKLKQRLSVKPLDISEIFSGDVSESSPNYLERVGSEYMGAAKDIMSNIEGGALDLAKGQNAFQQGNYGEAIKKTIEGAVEPALRTVGSVAGAAFAPITEALSPAIKPVVEKLASIPVVQDVIQKAADWADKHPEAAKDLEAVVNIATLGIGGKILTKTGEGVLQGTAKATEKVGQGLQGAGERAYRLAAPMEQSTSRALQAYEAGKPTLLERIKGIADNGITKPVTESLTAARQGLTGTEWQIGGQT